MSEWETRHHYLGAYADHARTRPDGSREVIRDFGAGRYERVNEHTGQRTPMSIGEALTTLTSGQRK